MIYLTKKQKTVKRCDQEPVLRIRIRMFLDLLDPDPDPLIRGTDPDPSTV
jgi:hypothetical protein